MVQLPSPEELKQLQNFKELFCLTIYAPHIEIDPTGATNPNKIELKNLLREAEIALLNDGVGPRDVDKTLQPARELLNNHEFWPLRTESLAIFMHPELFHYYYLPDDVPYILTIKRGFNLGPLLNTIKDNQPYLVLAISRKNVQLYEGDRFGIRKLNLKNFPSNLEAALNIDEYPQSTQTHAVAPAGDKGSEAFHGQYNVSQTNKQMTLQFFQLVDHSLRRFLQQKELPLILAGVEYLLPIYRQANTSPYLMTQNLIGNFDREDPDKIRELAWPLIKSKEG